MPGPQCYITGSDGTFPLYEARLFLRTSVTQRGRDVLQGFSSKKATCQEGSPQVYTGICYGPASGTKTRSLEPWIFPQLGNHVTLVGPQSQAALSQGLQGGLGTAQVTGRMRLGRSRSAVRVPA